MKLSRHVPVWVTAVILGVGGCGTSEPEANDAGNELDSAGIVENDADMHDIGTEPDVGDRSGRDAADASDVADRGQSDGGDCNGPCGLLDARAEFGANSIGFDVAFFGLTSPEQAASGDWELHIEAHRGGGTTCPTESSPSPSQTLIVTNVPLAPGMTYTREDGIAVSVLDFEGALLDDGVVSAALTAEVDLERSDVCTDCTPADGDSSLSFTIDALFEGGGTVAGHVFATHCTSMDF